MKLEELTLEGPNAGQSIHLGRFSPTLTFVYGENSSGKSATRKLFRHTLLGNSGATDRIPGHLVVLRHDQRLRLDRSEVQSSRVGIEILADNGSSIRHADESFPQLLNSQITSDLFDSIFAFSMRETSTNARRLARVLNTQLGVGIGPEHSGDRTNLEAHRRQQELLERQIAEIELKLNQLTEQRLARIQHHDATNRQLQTELAQVDNQIGQLQAQLGQRDSVTIQAELNQINAEIEALKLRIDTAKPEAVYPQVDSSWELLTTLYQRLDEIDNQIHRWRQLQSDIQDQRIKLRDEMLVWNELTLDSDQHPYHIAREILVGLESKVDQAERNSRHWVTAGGARVDTDQMARTLGELCQSMRDDVYQLCNELSHQYKHLRHKSAAAELKQLRRCYNEMGENIERLVRRRASVIRDIRSLDPAGADAIIRAENDFCQCAHHEGFLEARKRFVGRAPVQKEPVLIAPDLTHERNRLAQLEARRNELVQQLNRLDSELAEWKLQLGTLNRRRDEIVHQVQLTTVDTTAIDVEIAQLQNQLATLNERRSATPAIIAAHPILDLANHHIRRLTDGDLGMIYLEVGTNSDVAIACRSRNGTPISISQLEADRQDLVYLALALATKQIIVKQGSECPTLIDDAFCHIGGERINPTLELLRDVGDAGHQLVAMTQHRYLADRLPGTPVLCIENHPTPVISREPIAPTAVQPTFQPEPTFDVLAESAIPRSYPLSKYSRVEPQPLDPSIYGENWNNIELPAVAPQIYSPTPTVTNYRPTATEYSPVDVHTFTAPANVSPAVSETTLLEATGLFNPAQLRDFDAAGLTTIESLLVLDPAEERFGLSADLVDRWQAQLWLMLNIPTLRPQDATVLVACGIQEPSQVATSLPQQLYERIHRFLNTTRGRQTHWSGISIEPNRVQRWITALDRTRASWQGRGNRRSRQRSASSRSPANNHRRSERQERLPRERDAAGRGPWQARPPRMHSQPVKRPQVPAERTPQENSERSSAVRAPERTSRPKKPKSQRQSGRDARSAKKSLKFYLDLVDHIEAAPSIGPKTAERFEKIGVSTVGDFLKQTAESMASKLNYKRLSSELILQWQHQARMVCRIPNLRGHDAQLLVACDIIEPEDLAGMQPQQLFEVIGPFADTKEGLKIIRNGKKPDLEEITDWISWAGDMRSLQAA